MHDMVGGNTMEIDVKRERGGWMMQKRARNRLIAERSELACSCKDDFFCEIVGMSKAGSNREALCDNIQSKMSSISRSLKCFANTYLNLPSLEFLRPSFVKPETPPLGGLEQAHF